MPRLMDDAKGKPDPVPESFKAVEFLRALDLSSEDQDWPEADLRPVLHYLRGSKLLDLPMELKEVFPMRI